MTILNSLTHEDQSNATTRRQALTSGRHLQYSRGALDFTFSFILTAATMSGVTSSRYFHFHSNNSANLAWKIAHLIFHMNWPKPDNEFLKRRCFWKIATVEICDKSTYIYCYLVKDIIYSLFTKTNMFHIKVIKTLFSTSHKNAIFTVSIDVMWQSCDRRVLCVRWRPRGVQTCLSAGSLTSTSCWPSCLEDSVGRVWTSLQVGHWRCLVYPCLRHTYKQFIDLCKA